MVLQRAPQQAVVWGHTTAGATVTTTFDGKTLTTKSGADGIWRQTLPATEASTKAHTLTFKGVAGESASLNDVLFGDVFICRY
jgi:sialate O-acetylesterase